RSNSSLAPALLHQYSKVGSKPPSLYRYSDATPTETSISTGLASRFPGVPLLEEINGVLRRQPSTHKQPMFVCSFWFLSCSYISADKEEWLTHSLSHFRGEEPPRTVTCPLCDNFNYTCDSGWESWSHRQEHVAHHHAIGTTLQNWRPDFHLFQHLWQKRLIDDHDLKELKSGNHDLTRPPTNFTITNGRRTQGGRRQRSRYMSVVREKSLRRS
ncbi:hypothetical protein CC80DRAFT_371632, partial [Byssothecium circinans]